MLNPARQNRRPGTRVHGSSSRTGRHAQRGVLGALRDYDLVLDCVVHHVELVRVWLGPGGGERGEVLEWGPGGVGLGRGLGLGRGCVDGFGGIVVWGEEEHDAGFFAGEAWGVVVDADGG